MSSLKAKSILLISLCGLLVVCRAAQEEGPDPNAGAELSVAEIQARSVVRPKRPDYEEAAMRSLKKVPKNQTQDGLVNVVFLIMDRFISPNQGAANPTYDPNGFYRQGDTLAVDYAKENDPLNRNAKITILKREPEFINRTYGTDFPKVVFKLGQGPEWIVFDKNTIPEDVTEMPPHITNWEDCVTRSVDQNAGGLVAKALYPLEEVQDKVRQFLTTERVVSIRNALKVGVESLLGKNLPNGPCQLIAQFDGGSYLTLNLHTHDCENCMTHSGLEKVMHRIERAEARGSSSEEDKARGSSAEEEKVNFPDPDAEDEQKVAEAGPTEDEADDQPKSEPEVREVSLLDEISDLIKLVQTSCPLTKKEE